MTKPLPSKLDWIMNPTSIRGIRRQIERFHKTGKPVPQWVRDNLEQALKEQTPKDWKLRTYKVLPGTKLGAASKGRSLTPEEIKARQRKEDKPVNT